MKIQGNGQDARSRLSKLFSGRSRTTWRVRDRGDDVLVTYSFVKHHYSILRPLPVLSGDSIQHLVSYCVEDRHRWNGESAKYVLQSMYIILHVA